MTRRPSRACPGSGGRGRSWPATPTNTTPITPGKRRPVSPGGGSSIVGRRSKLPTGQTMGGSPPVVTMDFHVTSDCNQECPYCWGPQGFEQPVGTKAALRVIAAVLPEGARPTAHAPPSPPPPSNAPGGPGDIPAQRRKPAPPAPPPQPGGRAQHR